MRTSSCRLHKGQFIIEFLPVRHSEDVAILCSGVYSDRSHNKWSQFPSHEMDRRCHFAQVKFLSFSVDINSSGTSYNLKSGNLAKSTEAFKFLHYTSPTDSLTLFWWGKLRPFSCINCHVSSEQLEREHAFSSLKTLHPPQCPQRCNIA